MSTAEAGAYDAENRKTLMSTHMSLEADLLAAFETHSADGIRTALAAGASPVERIKGKRPIDCFIEGYLRSDEFEHCLRVLLDAGAVLDDAVLESVLLDDEVALRRLLAAGKLDIDARWSVPCAFTSCDGVTALHLCAEFSRVRCARVLLDAGADVNALADVAADGIGGQTPVFHTVNSIFNYCRPMLEILVESGADLDVRLRGLVWGDGAPWETLLVDVTPLSYAQCGLYRQFHRREPDVYSNLSYLYEHRYDAPLPIRNVPNAYLAPADHA